MIKKVLLVILVFSVVFVFSSVYAEEGHSHHEGHSQHEGHSHHNHHNMKDMEKKEKEEKIIELKAHVIELNCYFLMNAYGEKHLTCAQYCTGEQGKFQPLALMDLKTKKIYPVVASGHKNPNEKLLDFVEQDVTVKAKLIKKDSNEVIEILEINKRDGG